MIEIKFRVRDKKGKLLAIEIFNNKFGWHHVLIHDAREFGMEAPIQMGTYPDKIGDINNRTLFDKLTQ
jgi:hypothetical protein